MPPLTRRSHSESEALARRHHPHLVLLCAPPPWALPAWTLAERACVHQHINDGDEEAMVLVMKAKPLFLFMHMLFQKVAEFPPDEPAPGQEDYAPNPDL